MIEDEEWGYLAMLTVGDVPSSGGHGTERADRRRDHVRCAADRHDGDDGSRRRRNLAMAALIDRFGLFGLEKIRFRWEQLVGILLLAAGVALSLKRGEA